MIVRWFPIIFTLLASCTAHGQLVGPGSKVSASISNRVLYIDGTNNSDSVLVKVQYAGQGIGTVLDVQVSGASIPVKGLSPSLGSIIVSVKLHGYQGDDILDCSNIQVPTEMNGGQGNDTLRGGVFQDTIYADKGDDSISGGPGNDILYGLDGNDLIRGGKGDDILYGGAGSDTLYGDIDIDRLYTGDGLDSVFLGDPILRSGAPFYDVVLDFSKFDLKLDPTNIGWKTVPMN